MKTSKYIFALVFTVWCAVGNLYAVTSDYYSSVNGKSGADLFNAVHSVAKTGYTSGLSYDGLWTVYCSIDLNSSGKVWDMYSNATSYTCGGSAEGANYSKEGDSYNREHSIPKSWFGGSKSANTPGTDLFHVVPTDGYVNNMRSAYAFGEVSSASYTSQSGCKKGTPKSISISNSILNKSGSSSQSCSASTVFEPMDEFKGDFARGYFGTMIKWANGDYQTFTTAEGAQIFNTAYDAAHYYGLTGYGVALLLKWHREDPVSQKEIDRNNGIQTNQGNRNPFIDYPELVEYIWGEHSGETVTLSSLTPTFSGYTPPAATTYTVILSRNGVTEAISGLTGEYTLPAKNDEAAACPNWAFDGWSTTKVTNASSAPSYVTKVSAASTVYAVYSKTTGSNAPHRAKMGTVDDVLNYTLIGVASNANPAYADWSGKTSNSSAVYAGNTAGGNSSIQFRTNNSNSGIVTTTSGGTATKVVVTWNSNTTNGRSIDIYGKSTTYSSAADLYDSSKQGTKLGSIAKGSTTLNITGSYAYIGIRSNSGALYLDNITITWSTSDSGGSGGDDPTPSTTYDSEPEDCKCQDKLGTPVVTATPSDGTITLTWDDVTNATNGYTVTISKGVGYTTECGETSIGDITHSGTKNTCVITGLVNGLTYTTSVIANATATICESVADEDSATPIGCTSWDVAFSYSTYTIATGDAALAPSIEGTTYGAVTFESSKPSVLEVAADGKVTPKGAGTATITASWAGNETYCPKVMTTSQFTVTGTLSVTYDKNDGTATPATTTQEVDYNEPVTLAANTFSRTGYTFQGWATTRDGSKVYDDKQSDVTFTETTTLYAVWQANKHKVTFSPSPTGATVTVNSSSTSPVNNVAYGSTVNIVVTPAAHYSVGSVTANGGVTVTGTGNNWSFSMPDKDVAITVTMVEDTKYTVNWYVSGTPTAETNYAGEALAGIDDPTIDCNGKVFVGWTATANYSSDDTAPTDIFTNASTKTMPSNNDTKYYAVFATETTSGSGTVYKLVENLTNGKDYVFVTRNTAGNGYAFSSAITTGTSVTIAESGSDKIVSGTPADAIIWTAATGWSLTTKDATKTNKVLKINGSTFALDATGSNNLTWTTNFGLNGQSGNGNTKYYLQCTSDGTFSKSTTTGSSTNRVWAYEKTGGGQTTTYTDYTTSCTAPTEVTVTFYANYDGADPASDTQTIPYNTATALKDVPFSRTGHSFAGWATTADGTKVYDDEESVTLTKNLNLFALWTKNTYKVYFTPDMTGQASVTVNGASTSPQSVEFEGAVSIAIDPNVAYTVSGVSVTGGVTPSGSDNNWSFTMPASDVTITVTLTAKPTYTIRFYDSGALIGSAQTVISGQAATPPSTASLGCEGYTFVGWWTAELGEDNTETKTWVTNFTATQAQDYYAVYSHVSDGNGGDGQVTFTFSDVATSNSWQHDSNYPDVTISPISLHVDKGSSSYQGRWWNTDKTWRLYAGNTLTVSCSIGDVTAVTSTPSKTFTISEGVATYSGAVNLSSIVVSYGGGTTYYTTTTDCGACTTPTLEFAASEVTKYDGDEPFTNPLTVSGNNLNATLTFTSSNENKATVSSTGQVTIKDAMSNTPVTITATLAKTVDGDNCQKKVTASYTLNIYNKVTWSVNGIAHTEGNPTTYTTEGSTITAYPTDPDGSTVCGGKTFMGWTTAEVDETDTKPTTLYTSLSSMSNVHITQSTTFYAVFAEAGGVSDGVYGKGTSDNLTNGQRVLIVHSNTGRALSNAESGTGYEGKLMTITNDQITTTDETIIWTVETGSTGYKFKIGDKYVNAGESQGGKHYLYYDESPDEWTLTGSAPYVLSSSEDTGYQMEYYNSIFTTYTGTSGTAYEMDFYVPAAGYSAYSTTCGPNIKAAAVERLTSTKNQTVKSQALTVKGGSLEGNTLTATITGTDAAQFTCALEANTITSGGITTTYTISYTPTVFGATHEATLTFTDGTTSSDPITLRGRSLPEQFAIVAYDGSKYYVLDGTMTGEAKVVRPIEVTVSGGEVTMCPERAVYYLTQLATPNQNVHLVGQAGRLYGAGSSTGLNTKSLTSTSGTDWLLTTSDFDTYHVTNATSPARGVMYNETNNAFGHYATSNYGTAHYFGDIRLLPIGTICTCLNAPVATVTPRSTSATITWSAVANAIRYDVTCSGGSVSVSGTTATITGLTGNTTYTYSVKAVASGADCSLSYSDSFTTSSCDDVPQDVRVTPNVTEAIIRWTAEAEQAKVILYSDAECTTPVKTIDPAVSPCTVEDLAEDAHYYVKVFGGADKNCESAVVSFSTLTTAVEIVEWLTDGVKILLTGDDQTASIYIEDKQENAGGTTTKVAEDIFFSKYFEASGYTKLVGLFNGTDHAVDISDLVVCSAKSGAWSTTKASGTSHVVLADITKLKNDYGDGDKIMLPKNTEIILYSLRDDNKSDFTGAGCMDEHYNWDDLAANSVQNWYRIGKTNATGSQMDNDGHYPLTFGGANSIALKRDGVIIDLIGAGTSSGATDAATVCNTTAHTLGNGRTINTPNDSYGFFCEDGMAPPSEEYPEGYTTFLTTNRGFLMRKNEVVSGANAVEKNKTDFVTLCEEWVGVPIGNDGTAAERSCLSGDQFGYVGSYDYDVYYAQFDSITTITELENHKNDDGTITIPVDRLDTLSCSKLRITVYEGGVEKASKEYQVPIMIASGTKVTTDELFTKHNAETCASCDVVVFNGATLQKGEAASGRNAIHDLTLYPGSTLDLPSGKGDYSVNSVTYRVEGDNVPITSLNGNLMIESETQQLIVTRRITNDRYYFMSLPYDCNVADIRLSNGTPATNGVDFRLLEYDGEARALEGSLVGAPGHWKLVTDDVLEAGKGYAIAVSSKKPKEIVFPMTIPSKNLTYEERTKVTNTVDINEYTGAARNTNHNWNLIAHPYITKFEVTSATSVEAYWENPSRQDSAWVDDWTTWPEEDPTQPTDTTHTQNPDSTETHIGDILESGTVDNGLVWVLYANATMELTGGGQMVDFSSLEAVPWAQHRQFIKDLKIGGDVQKIGKYAFSQCTNLVTVTIAAPVTNLASYAFAGCTQLRSFRIESTQYISATTTTFDGVSTLSVYVPQSMYDQYSQNTPWNKMALSAFDGSSTTGGDGSNTNPTPRRVAEHPEGWTESAGGIYVTVPIVVDGKVDYEQHWINDVDDIKPFTAVFIQGDGKGQMTFNMYPATPAPKRMWQADRYETRDHTVFVGLTINGNGHKDMTSLRLRPDFTEDYKLNLDLLKFTTFYTSRPQIYFKTEKDQLAFRAVSDSLAANTWLPVGVYCRDAGEYTFALHDRYVWDEVEAVYLRDNVTGAETNLLMGNYTITTTGQIYTNTRFAVKVLLRRKVKDTPTMIDHTEDPNAPRKFFRDGLLYIMRDGKVYDLTGKPVQFDDLLNR